MEEVITIAQIVHRGTDILSLNNEEIEALVDEIYSTLKGSNDIKNIRLIDFLFTLKDFVNHVRAEQSKLPDLSMPIEAYIRQLLVDPDVVPIVSEKKRNYVFALAHAKKFFN
ncbi:M1249L [African swine fever virus]|uniref:M1249L n=1 Tax=African swine fever virus TaxID=10497 RepID=A0A5B8XBA1_ASF|nr:M1249L [African swine fever virus]